jgi:hypothetical protein
MYFSRYLADTDITNISILADTDTDTDMADTDIPFADTDISVSVSAKYIS